MAGDATKPSHRVAPIRERPRRRVSWPLRGLLAASLAVPFLLLAIAAWQNYRLVQRQAEERISIEAGELREHALEALKTYAIVLAWIDERTRGLTWDQIEHDSELHRLMWEIDALPQIDEVWMADGAGHPRVSGHAQQLPPIDISDQDCFAAEKEQDVGIFVGREQVGTLTGRSEFDICERRSTTDRSFDGIITVSARPNYFSEFYRTVSQDKHFTASLVRSDGSLLARYPPLPAPPVLASDSPFMQAIAGKPDSGRFWGRETTDGTDRFFAYEKIQGYPLYVTFGIPRNDVFSRWRANLFNYSLFAVPASLALFGMTLLAVRQIQRHTIASWRWRTTALRLRREMGRRAQAEAELRQAQKMEALGQLTGGVAHDFNNLLTVLQGCLEMLSGRQKDAQLEARVNMALQTIERGERLTGQLLAFARRQPLMMKIVDLNAELRRMSELLTRTVGGRITLRFDLAPDLWPANADVTQLELAVINLVINARDAMPNGGELHIRTFNEVSPLQGPPQPSASNGEYVGLEISDTGTGMSAEVAARAFEPFFTTKEADRGTGLGLSMVYGFARQSGGSVSIRTEIGTGTTVTLLLARAREEGDPASAGAMDLPQGTSP
jgi:two-component system NtrC family sensor kinase